MSVCWGCWPQYAPGSDPEIPEKCCEHRLPSRGCWLWVSVQVQCGAHQNLKLRRDETFSGIHVKDLTRKIVNKAHHVYMDNSPPPTPLDFSTDLYSEEIYCYGTVCGNRNWESRSSPANWSTIETIKSYSKMNLLLPHGGKKRLCSTCPQTLIQTNISDLRKQKDGT